MTKKKQVNKLGWLIACVPDATKDNETKSAHCAKPPITNHFILLQSSEQNKKIFLMGAWLSVQTIFLYTKYSTNKRDTH